MIGGHCRPARVKTSMEQTVLRLLAQQVDLADQVAKVLTAFSCFYCYHYYYYNYYYYYYHYCYCYYDYY